ncbi:microsomal signal peptidase subunit 3-like [Teratosphaeria destructans]|uniref:Signal peptidase subunit 3 n=1 Tax=Teratosphaeria destructans TaxID=418781 RepID=A0A9W7SYU0_9PEZI|nr:microsomal signal peptidase subunit 3-like [Teratosphaeria destructans]
MYNNLQRIQNVFGYFTSVAFAVGIAIALSVLLSTQTPKASLELRNVQVVKGRPHYYSTKREEYAHVKFDLDADLSTLFNWNTKQIFLYITASYPSTNPSTTPPSESIIWDAIIPSDYAPLHPNTYVHPTPKTPSEPTATTTKKKQKKNARKPAREPAKPYPAGTQPGIVRLENQKPKYQITDITGLIADRGNATLRLHWNVQPWVGALVWDTSRYVNMLAPGWRDLEGGEARFTFPSLKGTEVKKEDVRTETGKERNRGKPA